MALNSSHYKAHNCRGMANVRRIVSRLHFGVQVRIFITFFGITR